MKIIPEASNNQLLCPGHHQSVAGQCWGTTGKEGYIPVLENNAQSLLCVFNDHILISTCLSGHLGCQCLNSFGHTRVYAE